MRAKSVILALILSALCSQSVLAATWMQNDIGWWWQEDDGSYPVSSWKLINGYWYYFHSNGYMADNEWIGDYYVGSDGAMLVNTVTPDGYLVGADGAWIRESENSSETLTREKAYEVVNKYIRNHGNAFDWRDSMDGNTLVVAVRWRTGIFTHICIDLDTGECVEKGPYISWDGKEHWDFPLKTEYLFNVNEQIAKQ